MYDSIIHKKQYINFQKREYMQNCNLEWLILSEQIADLNEALACLSQQTLIRLQQFPLQSQSDFFPINLFCSSLTISKIHLAGPKANLVTKIQAAHKWQTFKYQRKHVQSPKAGFKRQETNGASKSTSVKHSAMKQP